MSSDSNGRNSETPAPGPSSQRSSRLAPGCASAWSAAGDALAALHNLEALLGNAGVPQRTIVDLIPELRSSAAVLREAFGCPDRGEPAAVEVAEHGLSYVDEFDALLDDIADETKDREALAQRAGCLASELEAAADLLALLERAAAPVATEVALNLVAKEAGRISGTARGQELSVSFDESSPDCVLTTDPYLLGPLLSLGVARLQGAGIGPLVLRARSTPQPHFVVEKAGADDGAFPPLVMRVMRWISASEKTARRVAERIGATLELADVRACITMSVSAQPAG